MVDIYGPYAFGFLHVSKQPEAAVAVLHNDVLPFYAELNLSVKAVLTDNRWPYGIHPIPEGNAVSRPRRAGSSAEPTATPYELYLALNDIEHRKTRVGSPKTNGPSRPSGLGPLGSGLEGLLTFER